MCKENKQVVKSPTATFRDLLEKAKPSIQQALPRHLTVDRITKISLTAATRNPLLLECDFNSLLQAVMQAAQLGLEPDTPLGECYFIPFYNSKRGCRECQFMPGYRGLIKLARQSGGISSIDAQVVYKNDRFECEFGLAPRLVHVPNFDGDRGEIRLFYSIIRMPGVGVEPIVEIMTLEEINAIKNRSKAKNSGPWLTDYAEMGRKTVMKRALKRAPMSSELWRAVDMDNKVETGESQVIDIETDIVLPTVTEQVAEKITTQANGNGQDQENQDTRVKQLLDNNTREQLDAMAVDGLDRVFEGNSKGAIEFVRKQVAEGVLVEDNIKSHKHFKNHIANFIAALWSISGDEAEVA